MDSSRYKDAVTRRGFKYHYFLSPATEGKATLLFLHGFPSTSYDWHKQVSFFVDKGYGVLVPDLLGYGGTDKPTDPSLYTKKEMADDIISLLDVENITTAFAISHDWGSALCSALAIYHAERFKGFAFLAVGYVAPSPEFNIEGFLESMKSVLGYEPFGYWLFFSEDGADKVIEENIDSFFSMLYPNDPKMWRTDMAERDALKSWVTQGKLSDRPKYLTEQELQTIKKNLLHGGLAAPLCWYKAVVHGHNNNFDKDVPKEKYLVSSPTFLAAAGQDYICTAAAARFVMEQTCSNLEVKEYETDHWVQLAAPEQLNADLLAWIKKNE